METKKLNGKVALVTGGSSGLGLATAKLFAAEGASVYITGRRAEELERAQREVPGAVAIQGDIAKLEDLDRIYATLAERAGKLDVLFANAGIGEFAPLGEITEAHFDKQFDINVRGTLFTVQKALPLMPNGSVIVLNGSNAAIKGTPAFSVYAATKAALRSFARGWASDLKQREIRVNVVAPGPVVTPAYRTSLGMNDAAIEQFSAQIAAISPAGRTGQADEVARAVLFLASADSSYVNGVELIVDGGITQI